MGSSSFVSFRLKVGILMTLTNLAGVSYTCCTKSKRSAEAATNLDSDIRNIPQLDAFYRELVTRKILHGLHRKEIPREAVEWRRSFGLTNLTLGFSAASNGHRVSNEEDFQTVELPTEYTVRVIANLQTRDLQGTKDAKNKRRSASCRLSETFSIRQEPRKRHHKKELVSGELWIPNPVWQKLSDPRMAFVFGHNDDQENSSSRSEVALTSIRREQEFVVMNISDSLTEINNRHAHASQLRGVLTGLYSESCESLANQDSNLNLLRSGLLSLQVKEVPHRNHQKRNTRRRKQNLIVDCDQQWDQAFLNTTSMFLRENLLSCCRRRIHVDFEEIGWSDWVVAPTGFDTSYCLGRCSSFGGFSSEDTNGHALYAELMNHGETGRMINVRPCCSPVKFAPLTITVLIGNREEMTQTFQDIIVTQCGCM